MARDRAVVHLERGIVTLKGQHDASDRSQTPRRKLAEQRSYESLQHANWRPGKANGSTHLRLLPPHKHQAILTEDRARLTRHVSRTDTEAAQTLILLIPDEPILA